MRTVEFQRTRRHRMSGNELVRVEMQTFLQALASYADRATSDPDVTFEQYYVSLMMPVRDAESEQAARKAPSH